MKLPQANGCLAPLWRGSRCSEEWCVFPLDSIHRHTRRTRVKQEENNNANLDIYYSQAVRPFSRCRLTSPRKVQKKNPHHHTLASHQCCHTNAEKFQTKPISADPPFTPQSKAHMKARVRYVRRNLIRLFRLQNQNLFRLQNQIWCIRLCCPWL